MLVTKSYVEVASETSDAFNQGTNSPDEQMAKGLRQNWGAQGPLHVHSSGPRCLSGSGSQGLRFGRREGATELAESPTFLIFASLTSDETVSTHNVPTRKWGEEQANLRRWHIPAQSHQHHQAPPTLWRRWISPQRPNSTFPNHFGAGKLFRGVST